MTSQLTGPGIDSNAPGLNEFIASIKQGHGRAREFKAGLNFVWRLAFNLAMGLAAIPGTVAMPLMRRRMGLLTALASTLLSVPILAFLAKGVGQQRGMGPAAAVLALWMFVNFIRGLAEIIRGVHRVYVPAVPHVRRWSGGELAPWATRVWLLLTRPLRLSERWQTRLDAAAEPILLLLGAGVFGLASFALGVAPVAVLCAVAAISLLASDGIYRTRTAWHLTLLLDQEQEQAELAASLDRQMSALRSREAEGIVTVV